MTYRKPTFSLEGFLRMRRFIAEVERNAANMWSRSRVEGPGLVSKKMFEGALICAVRQAVGPAVGPGGGFAREP